MNRIEHRRGQAAIETIIVAPLVVLALAGGLGLALAASDWLSASTAARAGARAAELGVPAAPAVRAVLPVAVAAGARVARREREVVVRLPRRRLGPIGLVGLPVARAQTAR